MKLRHCDAPDCDTWGEPNEWLDVYNGGELLATLCCRWCLARWGAKAQPTEEKDFA